MTKTKKLIKVANLVTEELEFKIRYQDKNGEDIVIGYGKT
jgi:hypothetical protein